MRQCILLRPMQKMPDFRYVLQLQKIVEKDPLIEERLALPDGEKRVLNELTTVMEKEGGLDREAALANMRFSFIEQLCVKPW